MERHARTWGAVSLGFCQGRSLCNRIPVPVSVGCDQNDQGLLEIQAPCCPCSAPRPLLQMADWQGHSLTPGERGSGLPGFSWDRGAFSSLRAVSFVCGLLHGHSKWTQESTR